MDGVWVGHMKFMDECVDESLFGVKTLQAASAGLWSRTTTGSGPSVLPGTSHQTQWPTFQHVPLQRSRGPTPAGSSCQGESRGSGHLFFRGSLSQWRGAGSGVKGGGGKRMLSLWHFDLNTQGRAAHTQGLKYWDSVCGQWTCVETGSHLLSLSTHNSSVWIWKLFF